ncbi:DUF2254 domain-containing protein [Guptibacillus algicola]|uniref:DUF2254 domain-containing protein n=1 Tax=Guptibacillus algicola TaxID=225844 RepID=UPI001CD70494|nr:DUF2254 domain-containing protein [Alkalihalobacillus algicola]MCA0986488.1 DUF2254 domain-containing protein [Alkalihalobacillus algicola]
MNDSKTHINLRNSFWFLPVVYGIISAIVVGMSTWIDIAFVSQLEGTYSNLFLASEKIAQSLYGPLVTAILTMTTISFSSIMVVLTTYSSQFSPRTLQDFISDRFTQHVLGIFVAGFIFALVNMLFLTGKDDRLLLSPVLTVLIAIACLLFFILFIHHSSSFVQVSNLIQKITRETLALLDTKEEMIDGERFEGWDSWEKLELRDSDGVPIYSEKMGYIQEIQYDDLVERAAQDDVIIRLNVVVGQYVKRGSLLGTVWMKDNSSFGKNSLLNRIAIGTERINTQDLEFSIQKLVEIALRAISPSVNDPHTAINCTNRLGSILYRIGEVYQPKETFFDSEKNLRVMTSPKSFFQYLYKSFYLIRHYGKDDVAVMNGVLEALILTAEGQREEIKSDVRKFHAYIMEGIDFEHYPELDKEFIMTTSKYLEEICKK